MTRRALITHVCAEPGCNETFFTHGPQNNALCQKHQLEHIKKQKQEYYNANRARLLSQSHEWRKNNPDKIRAYVHGAGYQPGTHLGRKLAELPKKLMVSPETPDSCSMISFCWFSLDAVKTMVRNGDVENCVFTDGKRKWGVKARKLVLG